MLSDAEQRRLTELELQLRTDDPAFVQRFDERRHRPHHNWRGLAALLALSVAVTVAGFGLVLGDVGAVIVGLMALVAGITMWIRRRHRT
jgi:uncharacterized membrane protein HdeD (DUF308 family)